MKPTLLVLAAGMGSRYGGLKQLDAIGPSGETIMEYTVYDALKAGFGKVVFVIRPHMERDFRKQVLERFDDALETALVFQEVDISDSYEMPLVDREKPWGTGHAVLVSEDEIDEPFAMVNADDFYGREALRLMGDFLKRKAGPSRYAMVSYALEHTLSEHGHVSRGVCTVDKGTLVDIEEHTEIERKDGDIVYRDESRAEHTLAPDTPVSMNLWGMHPSIFSALSTQFGEFLKQHGDEGKAEFYLPVAISRLLERSELEVDVLPTEAKWFGITYYEDKQSVQQAIREMVEKGTYPKNLWKAKADG